MTVKMNNTIVPLSSHFSLHRSGRWEACNYTCTPASPLRFLALLLITFSRFCFVVCDLDINMLIHYTLNIHLGRPKSVSATGRGWPRSVGLARARAAPSDVLRMHDQIHPRRNGAIGGLWRPHRTTSGSNQENINGTEQQFRTEIFLTPKRTETAGSGKLCMGCERHQTYKTRDGKETNTSTKEKENRPDELCAAIKQNIYHVGHRTHG